MLHESTGSKISVEPCQDNKVFCHLKTNPIMNFPVFISTYLEEALSKAGFSSADVLSQIKASADSKFGDYQFNGSMGLAKEAKVSPRKVAEKIVEFFALPDVLEPVEIAGPGF